MKTVIPLVLVLSLMAACTGSDSPATQVTDQAAPSTTAAKKTPASTGLSARDLKIKSITIAPERATPAEDLTASAVLEREIEDVEFEYRWFVNEKEQEELNEATLPRNLFKKGDWVYCDVLAYKGEAESSVLRSKYVRILGRPPQLSMDPVPRFNIPGRFVYTIRATDPDRRVRDEFAPEPEEEEPSTLKYELISPTDAGITLNEATGDLAWDIPADAEQKFGKKLEIKFRVSTEGGSATNSIFLNLARTAAPAQPEETPESEQSETD